MTIVGRIVSDEYRNEQYIKVYIKDNKGNLHSLDMRAGLTQYRYRQIRHLKGTNQEVIVDTYLAPHPVLTFSVVNA